LWHKIFQRISRSSCRLRIPAPSNSKPVKPHPWLLNFVEIEAPKDIAYF